jgi:hypothetical protein
MRAVDLWWINLPETVANWLVSLNLIFSAVGSCDTTPTKPGVPRLGRHASV